jgi:hypothetical protein
MMYATKMASGGMILSCYIWCAWLQTGFWITGFIDHLQVVLQTIITLKSAVSWDVAPHPRRRHSS